VLFNVNIGRPSDLLFSVNINDDDDDDDNDDDDDDDNDYKPVWPTWAVGALFSGARRIHINRACFLTTPWSGRTNRTLRCVKLF
jgi:hypothetical protein